MTRNEGPDDPTPRRTAREHVADFWDGVLAEWLRGSDALRPPLDAWIASYHGTGAGAVDLSHYPDPYVGDLRGTGREPRLVVLGLNPGIGYDSLQSRDGTWAERIRQQGYSRCSSRSPAEDPETWVALHGKESRYWANLVRFAQRWLGDPRADVGDILNFELYPWHSAKVTGPMQPPPALLREFVWDPIAEIDTQQVFAFGADWFGVCEDLGLPCLAKYGAGRPFPSGATYQDWRLGIYELPSGQHVVVSAQPGYAGPPGLPRLEVMRGLVDATYQLTHNPGSPHDPHLGIPWEIVEGLETHSVRRPLRLALARLAQRRAVTADAAGKTYVAVRPVMHGVIACYVHTEYVDIALSPERADLVEVQHGWKVIKRNPTTAYLRVWAEDLDGPGSHELLDDLLAEAVDKSEAGPSAAAGGPPAKDSTPTRCVRVRRQR